jgi:hypothetical protein
MRTIKRITSSKRIEPLPSGDPPEPWGAALRSVWSPFIVREPSISADFGVMILESQWAQEIGYVYRNKWNRKHKCSKHRFTELRGNVLWSLLELCIQVHAVHPIGRNYPNASQWFDKICWERKASEKQITAVRLWFREGRTDIQVVGASGAQWSGSKNVLKDALTCQSTKKVSLMPDAGTLENKQVLQHCKNALDLLVEWGYAPYVGWWDQDSKDQPDIDELEDFTTIQLLNPPDFFEMAEPDEENIPPEWAWKNWLKSRRFTPTQIVELEEFCFGDLPESDAVISANSGLGTRKTGAGIEVTRLSGRRSIWLGYRNNLLIQTCSRASKQGINILHIREDDGVALVADVHTNLALCVDSIHHVDGYFKGTDVYLDETCSTLLHTITGGTLGDEQGKAIAIFTRALQECDRIFLLDGNLSDIFVDFIVKISGKKHDIRILNSKKPWQHHFQFVLGVDVDKEIKKRDKSGIISKMFEPDVIPWVVSDSKAFTDELHLIFQKHGKFRGYVLNKDTGSEPWAKEFLDDPDEFIKRYNPHYFIVSPTGESGLSCTSRGHFTHKFSIFTGVQSSNSQYQIMIRLRDNSIPHYVLCPERSLISSSNRNSPGAYSATAYAKMLEDRVIQSAILASQSSENPGSVLEIIGKAIARSNNDWWEFSATLGALDNFEQNYLRRCLMHVLESAGHSVEVIYADVDEQIKEDQEWAREKRIEIHSTEIYDAHDLTDKAEADKLVHSGVSLDRVIQPALSILTNNVFYEVHSLLHNCTFAQLLKGKRN